MTADSKSSSFGGLNLYLVMVMYLCLWERTLCAVEAIGRIAHRLRTLDGLHSADVECCGDT